MNQPVNILPTYYLKQYDPEFVVSIGGVDAWRDPNDGSYLLVRERGRIISTPSGGQWAFLNDPEDVREFTERTSEELMHFLAAHYNMIS